MNQALETFKKYTNFYTTISDKCILKIEHTYRVVGLCEKIAISLNLSSEDIYIAKLCGLLHDIGRFEQWKRYQTFKDSISIDHGNLGVEILKNNNLIRSFILDNKYDSLILSSILYHNKYDISDEISDREKLFAKIVRDADKLDILYLYTSGGINIDINNEIFSNNIINSLKSEQLIKSTSKETKADILSISLGFVFDINFKKSFEILKEEDYINKEIDIYKNKNNNNTFKEQIEQIRDIINNYINRKLDKINE